MRYKKRFLKEQNLFGWRQTGLLILLLYILSGTHIGTAQPNFGQNWQKFSGNPLFSTVGEPGSWNSMPSDNVLSAGHGILDDSEFKLYIGGIDGQKHTIGLLISTHLDSGWTFYSGNPILKPGQTGNWDDKEVGNAMVIKDSGIYKMWYTGKSKNNIHEIGYATSTDGIVWEKDTNNNPVLKIGSQDSWDYAGIFAPYVIKDGSIYKMWYHGFDGAVLRIGYAESNDGIQWTKSINNPILNVGEPGSWDHAAVALPIVRYEHGKYLMWYIGLDDFQSPNSKEQTGFAISDDGIHWLKDTAHNPILPVGTSESWDKRIVVALDIFNVDGAYKMLFGGMDLQTNYGVGLAIFDNTSSITAEVSSILHFLLYQNYPNPFNTTTIISYSLSKTSMVTLKIYNLLGQEIRTLVDDFQSSGEKSIVWDGRNQLGQIVNSGIYIYSSKIGNEVNNKRMVFLK